MQREIENRRKEGGDSEEEKIPRFLEKLFRYNENSTQLSGTG